MKSGCGCFLLLLAIFGLIGTIDMAVSGTGEQFNIIANFIILGIFLLAGWKLLKSGRKKEPSVPPPQQQQTFTDMPQTFTSMTQTSTNMPQTFSNTHETITSVRRIIAGMQQTIHPSSGGPAQTAAAPDQPVTFECPGCGAPVTVTPSKSGECEYCGTLVRYGGAPGNG